MRDREHQVAAYEDVAGLASRVADFAASSLRDGVPVVTISRPGIRRAVERLMVERGTDTVRARRDGTLLTLDVDETMSRLMVDGRPDPGLFAEVVASLVPPGDAPVSAFGEMVAVLWERGEVAAALELEALWNAALVDHRIRLLCAYPGELLARAELDDVARMCSLHDTVSLIGAHPGPGAIPTGPGAALSSVHLPVSAAVASVRHFARETLTSWGLPDLIDDVALVTSELATNAVRHGSSPFRTSMVRSDGVVRVSVEDGSRAWPQPQEALPEDQDGRGLAIVAILSERTGCDSTPHGKVAWAELAV
jgi:hypothetical protein